MKKKVTRKNRVRPKLKSKFQVCEKCEHKTPVSEKICPQCGSKRFLPEFVKKRKVVRGNFSVNIVNSFENPDKQVLNLYKWFPGRTWRININTLQDWRTIKNVIDNEFGPLIGWKTKSELDKYINQEMESASKSPEKINESITKIPNFLLKLAKKIDFKKLNSGNQQSIVEGFETLAEVAIKYDKGFQAIFNNLIKKLKKEGTGALVEFEELMKFWSLRQITGVASIVKERVGEISRFKSAIKSDETFEIKGKNSIHRIIEGAMWIVDERYWLLHSNETLRKFIGDAMSKRDKKKYGKKRPDFVCGSVDNKLIIMELKRPSHKLTTEDLQQLETYLMVAEDYSVKYSGYEAYLVGKRIDSELKRRMKYRRRAFKILTYSDLIDNTERRYKDYLRLIEKKEK